MRCDAAENEISARLDGTRDARFDEPLDEHLASCAKCRSFEARIRRLRESVRLEPAEEVPGHLVARIMEATTKEVQRSRLPVRIPRPSLRSWARPAAVFLAGAAASALALGGLPVLRRGVPPALAKEIPQLVAEASLHVEAYSATVDIVESNFHEDVPERRFEATIVFRSPERFRAEVTDRTRYPSDQWPRNDLTLTVDGSRWQTTGPATCPRESLPVCATGRRETTSVRGREPFDGDTPLPSDIVVPVRTLTDRQRLVVSGASPVLGRRVVAVTLPYRDAVPLFAYLHEAGSWRPFFPLDPVTVLLDRETWLPLAYEVRASGSAERGQWAARNALPRERSDEVLFSTRVRSFDLDTPTLGAGPLLAGTDDARDGGFRDVPLDSLSAVAGYEPLLPGDLAGLRPHRAGTITRGRANEIVLSYARGLAWLKIRQTRSWDQPTLYGNVSSLASPISVGRGLGYEEPATATLGRRLSIHTETWDVFLESNLSAELLGVAASLRVTGEEAPREWLVRRWPGGIVREQVSLDRVKAQTPYLLVPKSLPDDYDLTVHLVTAAGQEGVTLYYRRDMEPDGVGVKLHLAPGAELPPPLDPETFAVRVQGTVGRYTPARSELEWVAEGVYRSLSAHGFDLAHLVEIAESLAPPDAADRSKEKSK